ncbi:hypothetical protein ZWY2020_057523 [Hordeum vulgare]|nr:hypothetical protein ZWY2020_057523 [Hordeum vulgare]
MAGERAFYSDGFNAYWLMYMASNPDERSKVVDVLDQASRLGATVVRTWAFSDGQASNRPLQIIPGVYNEKVFVGLDFVIAEAKKRGIYLILSLVNNMDNFGGKKQYVQWARDRGHYLRSDDDFFSDAVTQKFYKNHIKRMVTRVNTFTRVAYKDEPTIFAWTLVRSMSAYVKSVDPNHMVEIGMEGFYGESTPERKRFNLGQGTAAAPTLSPTTASPPSTSATIHFYPDQWMPGSSSQAQVEFTKRWMASHIEDAATVLGKPLLVAEFGWSARPAATRWRRGTATSACPTTAAVVSQECAKIASFTPAF